MNSVNLIGRMVNEPEIKTTTSGKKVITLRLAVDAGKDKDGNRGAYFFYCVAWNGTAENIAKYFNKGDKIGISGILTSRDYEDKDGNKRSVVEVLINSFDFCNDKRTEKVEESGPSPKVEEIVEVPFEL